MDCIKCGNELRDGDMFCNKCGNKVRPAHGGRAEPAAIYNCVMTILYAIALLTCLICNLAAEGTLSWFYIVLCAAGAAYSVTNIPVIAGKHKLIAAGLCSTVMVYVLLFACNWYAKGDWLFSVAYPLATLSLLFAWVILLICGSRHMDWLLKSALISLISGAATITINPFCNYLLGGSARFYDYLSPFYWPPAMIGNKIVFICCVCYSVTALILNTHFKYSKKA